MWPALSDGRFPTVKRRHSRPQPRRRHGELMTRGLSERSEGFSRSNFASMFGLKARMQIEAVVSDLIAEAARATTLPIPVAVGRRNHIKIGK